MHGSEGKDALHSTLEEDPRPKLLPRVLGSLAIVGLMVGLMIGRLTTPDPVELLQVTPVADGLVVWFNSEPKLHGEHVDGTVALLFDAQGQAGGQHFDLLQLQRLGQGQAADHQAHHQTDNSHRPENTRP